MGQLVDDKAMEERFTRTSFVRMAKTILVKLLSLPVVGKLVALTRQSGEPNLGDKDLRAYCMNSEQNNYERDALTRGVRVYAAAKGGNTARSSQEFYMRFSGEVMESTSYLNSLLAVQRLKHNYELADSKYESVSFAMDMYTRPVHPFGERPSLAAVVLGLDELKQPRPSKGDVDRLLKRIAMVDAVNRKILELSSAGKPPPTTAARSRAASPGATARLEVAVPGAAAGGGASAAAASAAAPAASAVVAAAAVVASTTGAAMGGASRAAAGVASLAPAAAPPVRASGATARGGPAASGSGASLAAGARWIPQPEGLKLAAEFCRAREGPDPPPKKGARSGGQQGWLPQWRTSSCLRKSHYILYITHYIYMGNYFVVIVINTGRARSRWHMAPEPQVKSSQDLLPGGYIEQRAA